MVHGGAGVELRQGREGGGRAKRSDPDEFFRRFPGGFLFFPVVTSSGGSSLQTIRSKIFTTTPADSAATGAARSRDGGESERARERERVERGK